MATYNVDITSKAVRTFGDSLEKRLIQSHRSFDNTASLFTIKVIMHHCQSSHGYWLRVGGYHGDQINYRFIRVIIDIAAGERSYNEKQELLQKTMECCMDYQGKHAPECEIEVRINEVEEGDVMVVRPFNGQLA